MAAASTEMEENRPAGIESTSTEGGEGESDNAPKTPNEDAVAIDNDAAAASDTPEADTQRSDADGRRQIPRGRVLAYGVLPALALILALGAGYLKWLDSTAHASHAAAAESVRAATDSTVALLSYKPDTVDKGLVAAEDRLTGEFKNSYTALVHDVVIPGSKQKQISALANVPAAASVSASVNHAVVLVFVNQTVNVGNDPPSSTASSVRVTLDKVRGRWLISQFDPV